MRRSAIDFGIDLGTTNSAIAVLNGVEQTVIKNNFHLEHTTSAVWIDPDSQLFVGEPARKRIQLDPANTAAEFKLNMGRDHPARFARSGRVMQPEELSAEVLKVLKASVKERLGEHLTAAVITVPAAFELPQNHATGKAAELAGISIHPLLQEPVAAALAYGFQTKSDRVFWLVYDLGGGTFDAAVIQVRDGRIEVVNHSGDNHLGGKLIDWAIVEQLLIPALVSKHPLTDFRRGNEKWNAAIAKLKINAEDAKISVSQSDSAWIQIENLCRDDRDEPIDFNYKLERADVARLAKPFLVRSMNLCKSVLEQSRLSVENIEKVLLVGGPTMAPYVRERLADPEAGLGIAMEYSVDPLTVVARGAAIFAGTQRLPDDVTGAAASLQRGTFVINFPNWRLTGNEREPRIAGSVSAPNGEGLDGVTVQLTNSTTRPPVRTGKIGVAANGGFMATILMEEGKQNEIVLELCDATGHVRDAVTEPPRLTYVIGVVPGAAPLTHSVGVALANNEVEWFFEKGTPLPAKRRAVLKSTVDLKPNEDHAIRVPVIEGQYSRADRNRVIGVLEISGAGATRHVPVGSDVEVTITIDSSRELKTKAYVPILDDDFENSVIQLGMGAVPSHAQLAADAEKKLDQLADLRRRVEAARDERGWRALERIDSEGLANEVERSLAAAAADADSANLCQQRLLDLQVAMDAVESALEWPAIADEARKLINSAEQVVDADGNADDRPELSRLVQKVEDALRGSDPDLLRLRTNELRVFAIRILDRKGLYQAMRFEQLSNMTDDMRDIGRAAALVSRGLQAMNNNDPQALRAINQELVSLLPTPPPPPDTSTVTRYR